MQTGKLNHLIPCLRFFLPSLDSSVTRGRDPARRSIRPNAEDPIRDNGMVYLGNIRHRSPRSIEIKEPYVVVICGPVVMNIEIADVGVEIVRGSSYIFV